MSFPRISIATTALSLGAMAVLGFSTAASADNGCPSGSHYGPDKKTCVVNGGGNGGNNNGNGNGGKDNGTGNTKKDAGTATPGGTTTLSGSGAKPNSTVTVTTTTGGSSAQGLRPGHVGLNFVLSASETIVLGTTVADGVGNWSLTVTLPPGLSAGPHTLVASYIDKNGKPASTSFAVQVVKAAGAGTTSVGGIQLPRTGAEIGTVSVLGLALVGGGAMAIAAGRRRRSATTL